MHNFTSLFPAFALLTLFLSCRYVVQAYDPDCVSEPIDSQSGPGSNYDSSSDPDCDYVVYPSNLHDAIGVCLFVSGKSYRTDYDSDTNKAVYLSFESNDCTGESQVYLDSTNLPELIYVNVGSGNLCKTFATYNQRRKTQDGETVVTTEYITSVMYGFCTLHHIVGIFYIHDYCKDNVHRWRWFHDSECQNEIQKENYHEITGEEILNLQHFRHTGMEDIVDEDLVGMKYLYYRSYGVGDVKNQLLNQDETIFWENVVLDNVCVNAQKGNDKPHKGASWSRY